ncbi:MAG: hypothetical protein IPK68_19195 [Bdellovibrionales bacterium]|nr:hypothetical protein [Bdellovibrionales bacterium]
MFSDATESPKACGPAAALKSRSLKSDGRRGLDLILYFLLITSTPCSELISIASSAKPGVQRKTPEALRIICHDRLPKLESLVGPLAFGDSVVSKRHGSLAEEDLRISGSSSAWCSAHKGSAAAGRMFEDPEILRLFQPAPLEFGTTIMRVSSNRYTPHEGIIKAKEGQI